MCATERRLSALDARCGARAASKPNRALMGNENEDAVVGEIPGNF